MKFEENQLPSFDQHQRYQVVAQMLQPLLEQKKKVTVLEVGANRSTILGDLLPTATLLYSDIVLPDTPSTHFVQANALALPFQEQSVDFVLALDVFEHIEHNSRASFLSELWRVAKKGVLVAGPFNTEGVRDAEVRINGFYRALYGEDHPWLKEHIENGLPCCDEVRAFFQSAQAGVVEYAHGSLKVWERLLGIAIMSEHHEVLNRCIRDIDLWYAKGFLKNDASPPCYRHFFFGIKELADEERKQLSGILNEEILTSEDILLQLNLPIKQMEYAWIKQEQQKLFLSLHERECARDKRLESLEASVSQVSHAVQNVSHAVQNVSHALQSLADSLSIKKKIRRLFGLE